LAEKVSVIIMKKLGEATILKNASILLLLVAILAGMVNLLYLIGFGLPRTDEMFTYIETHNIGLLRLVELIHNGLDNSYLHPILIWFFANLFGPSILVPRLLSFFFWVASLWIFFRMICSLGCSKWLAVGLTFMLGFGALGRFIAVDGRFYGLAMLTTIFLLKLLVSAIQKGKTLSYFSAWLVILIGLFITPVTGLSAACAAVSLLALWVFLRQKIWLDYFVQLSVVIGLALLPYLLLNLNSPILGDLGGRTTEAVASTNLMGIGYFFSTLYAWNAWLNFPLIPWWVELAGFLMGFLVFWFLDRASNNSMRAVYTPAVKFVVCFGFVAVGLVLAQSLLSYFLPLKPWTMRYYVGIMPALTLLIAGLAADLKPRKIQQIALLIVAVGLLTDSLSYVVNYEVFLDRRADLERVQQSVQSAPFSNKLGKTIFLSQSWDIVRLYGQVYTLSPELRSSIILVIPDNWRNNWMGILSTEYSASNYYFYSQISADEWSGSQVVAPIDDPRLINISTQMDYKSLDCKCALISGKEWLNTNP
jgi:hypothetical protein